MLYNALDVAKYIISFCFANAKPVSNLKLQKVLYFTWVDFFNESGKPLFLDDICAWQLGPVIPDVYYEYCSYGGRPICVPFKQSLGEEDSLLLNRIIGNYMDVPASTLVNITHAKGSAWDVVYRNGCGNREVIPYSLIRQIECRG